MEKALGPGPCPSPALVATLRELGSPSLRIGGDSQDLAGPTTAYRYFIPPPSGPRSAAWPARAACRSPSGSTSRRAHSRTSSTTIAEAEQAIPAAQLSFSLGNEPDLYGISHIFPDEPGVTIPAFRPSPWTAEEYASEWQSRRAMLGQVRIEGPDLAGIGWRTTIGQMLRNDPPDVLDVHAYPTSACGAPQTTAARLLTEHASVGLVEKYDWLLKLAQAVHRPAIVSESNSASCGGKPGVSNTPVAGVWAARYVVAALLGGFQQVRFHSAGGSYDPLVFNPDGTVTLQPLGQALLFLHRWIPLGSRIAAAPSRVRRTCLASRRHATAAHQERDRQLLLVQAALLRSRGPRRAQHACARETLTTTQRDGRRARGSRCAPIARDFGCSTEHGRRDPDELSRCGRRAAQLGDRRSAGRARRPVRARRRDRAPRAGLPQRSARGARGAGVGGRAGARRPRHRACGHRRDARAEDPRAARHRHDPGSGEAARKGTGRADRDRAPARPRAQARAAAARSSSGSTRSRRYAKRRLRESFAPSRASGRSSRRA